MRLNPKENKIVERHLTLMAEAMSTAECKYPKVPNLRIQAAKERLNDAQMFIMEACVCGLLKDEETFNINQFLKKAMDILCAKLYAHTLNINNAGLTAREIINTIIIKGEQL